MSFERGASESASSGDAAPKMVSDSRDGIASLLRQYAESPEVAAAHELVASAAAPKLGGFWGASLGFFAAAFMSSRGAPRQLLVVTASLDRASELYEEFAAFLPSTVSSFPAWESLFLADSTPDGDVYQRRVTALEQLLRRDAAPAIVVAPIQAIVQPVPRPDALTEERIELCVGDDFGPRDLAESLAAKGYRATTLVENWGEFSLRGDVLDFYPLQSQHPLRVEFFGDTIDSIRSFSSTTQRSLPDSSQGSFRLLTLDRDSMFQDCIRDEECLITDYLSESAVVFFDDLEAIKERASRVLKNLLPSGADSIAERFFARVFRPRSVDVHALPTAQSDESVNLGFGSVERLVSRDISRICDELSVYVESGGGAIVYCESEAEAKRFREILADHDCSDLPRLEVELGPVRRGFEIRQLNRSVLTSRELFHRHLVQRVRQRPIKSRAIESFVELSSGDYVVHMVHGIAKFHGMERFKKDGVEQEFLSLGFRGGVKIYVPVSKIDLIQKYVGSGGRPPLLDRIGGKSWSKKKESVETALLDFAGDLLQIQALRHERTGIRFPEDSQMQREFEALFPFDDTPDQVVATEAIKEDMQSPRPMDRLICGDVGYGKTELAMRSAFKAVEGGKQVAVLVPTTVLAQQHFRTFSARMKSFPMILEVLSRFRTGREQTEILAAAAEGRVDILIGTHRLLSKDVVFKDLGLVIVDEEQRFGVEHKEKLKRLRSTVDVLTLTATPIPRTLHMSVLGLRDISSLRTPPLGRTAVKTEVIRFEPKRIREMIIRELNRDGQVFFIHNRIHDIDRVRHELERAVPEARFAVAHGRMKEEELEEVMVKFIGQEVDVLLSTTIVENGIDIRNANTMFIDEADRYGLSEMHQLRGRVGRHTHQAFCYLILPDHRRINPDAEKRLQALVEFADLGAGFQIAMRDLEIRGSGNILGPEQSGHIAAVGYDMYCRLLEKTVRRLRNEDYAEPVHVEVDLAVQAMIPDEYLSSEGLKLEIYRHVSYARTPEDLDELADELKDRFGELPDAVRTLLDIQMLRVLAAANGIERLTQEASNLVLEGRETLKNLLENCTQPVTVLNSRTVAIPLVDRRRKRRAAAVEVDDEFVFRVALRWLQTKEFPQDLLRPGRAARARRVDVKR